MLPEQEEVHRQIINFSFPRKDPDPSLDMDTATVPSPALSTTSSATTDVPTRPLQLDTDGNWTATQTAPLNPAMPVPLPAAALASSAVTTHRPTYKLSETAPPYEGSASSISSSSLKRRESIKATWYEQTRDPAKRTKGGGFKDTVFFALVLLPLSCWYTRGGRRLHALDEEDRAVRALPELRRPLPGRKADFGHADADADADVYPGRRESFSAAARRNSFSQRAMGHGRSNSLSQVPRGAHGRSDSFAQNPLGRSESFTRGRGNSSPQHPFDVAESFSHGRRNSFTQNPVGRSDSFRRGQRDSWSGTRDLERIEVADYGVDRGADFDALRLSDVTSQPEESVPVPPTVAAPDEVEVVVEDVQTV